MNNTLTKQVKVKKIITKEKPEILYRGESGEAFYLGEGMFGKIYTVIFDNPKLGSGWFYEQELC